MTATLDRRARAAECEHNRRLLERECEASTLAHKQGTSVRTGGDAAADTIPATKHGEDVVGRLRLVPARLEHGRRYRTTCRRRGSSCTSHHSLRFAHIHAHEQCHVGIDGGAPVGLVMAVVEPNSHAHIACAAMEALCVEITSSRGARSKSLYTRVPPRAIQCERCGIADAHAEHTASGGRERVRE